MKPSEFLKKEFDFALSVISNEFKETMFDKLDKRFIDTEEVDGTLFGLEFAKIREILDWFRKQEFNPYNWKNFKEQLKRKKLR